MTQTIHPPDPLPLSEPVIIDYMLLPVRVAIKWHGGVWNKLADGDFQVDFPTGTTYWPVENAGEGVRLHVIQFPDGTQLSWSRRGRLSPVNGWPQQMSTRLLLLE